MELPKIKSSKLNDITIYPIYLLKVEDIGYIAKSQKYLSQEDITQDITLIDNVEELENTINKLFVIHPYIYSEFCLKSEMSLNNYNSIENEFKSFLYKHNTPIIELIIKYQDPTIRANNILCSHYINLDILDELRINGLLDKYESRTTHILSTISAEFDTKKKKENIRYSNFLSYYYQGKTILWDDKKGKLKYKRQLYYNSKIKKPIEKTPTQKINEAFYYINRTVNSELTYHLNASIDTLFNKDMEWIKFKYIIKLLPYIYANGFRNNFKNIIKALEVIYIHHKLFINKEIKLYEKKFGDINKIQEYTFVPQSVLLMKQQIRNKEYLLKCIPNIKKALILYNKKLPKCL